MRPLQKPARWNNLQAEIHGVPKRECPDSPWPEMAVKALESVRVYLVLIAMALLEPLGGVELTAQVGNFSGVTQVALVVRAPSYVTSPNLSHRKIGRRGELTEAAVRIRVPASSGYRVVARINAGTLSRVWIQVSDDYYKVLTPGDAVTLPGGGRGSSEREVRYLTDGSTSTAEVPVHFELVIDPVI